VQTIAMSNSAGAAATTGTWTLALYGVKTVALEPAISAYDLRRALLPLLPTVNPIPTLRVTREANAGQGYFWHVTFTTIPTGSAGYTTAAYGDVPALVPSSLLTSTSGGSQSIINVSPAATGARPNGAAEVQLVYITATNANVAVPSTGFFKLGVGGAVTPFLSVGISVSELASVLMNLQTTGTVTVNALTGGALTALGARTQAAWTVTFTNSVANVPVITTDASRLVDGSLTVLDGDNSLTATTPFPLVCPLCVVGETPAEYGTYTTSSPTTLAYTIPGLTAGRDYRVRVKAINARGWSVPTDSTAAVTRVPLQRPSAPATVTAVVDPASATGLVVTYTAPPSDGGDVVLSYLIEYSLSSAYGSPVSTVSIQCPASRKRAVWTVTTAVGAGAITQGSFTVTVSKAGVPYTTTPIAWNAASVSDSELLSGGSASAGTDVYCTSATAACASAVTFPGSMQSHLQDLLPLSTDGNGVLVTRTAHPTVTGGFTWTITFLGDGSDYSVSAAPSTNPDGFTVAPLVQVSGQFANGQTCLTPYLLTGLTKGSAYYIRVSAYNSRGFGPATLANAGAGTVPMAKPGRPSSVTLKVFGGCQLRTCFNAPADSGGDPAGISSYQVLYADNSNFNSASMVPFYMTTLGGVMCVTLNNLTPGLTYYVGVSACNSQGCGTLQNTQPPSEHPRKAPGGPASVRLGVTSNTKITVKWTPPTDNGGDPVTFYTVKWNTNADMMYPGLTPDKDAVQVQAAVTSSYTIEGLTPTQTYYVVVSACNREGCGVDTTAVPLSVVPTLQRPGKVSRLSVTAASTANPLLRTLTVSTYFPFVPDHGLPCSGAGNAAPHLIAEACPTGMGRGTMADGGTPVTKLVVVVSDDANFSQGHDVQVFTRDINSADLSNNVPISVSLSSLSVSTTYYVRVIAHNAVGPGQPCDQGGLLCDGAAVSV